MVVLLTWQEQMSYCIKLSDASAKFSPTGKCMYIASPSIGKDLRRRVPCHKYNAGPWCLIVVSKSKLDERHQDNKFFVIENVATVDLEKLMAAFCIFKLITIIFINTCETDNLISVWLYCLKSPGVGVTKPNSSVPFFSEFCSIVKTHVSYCMSRLYLAGVAAAQLRWHLSNINVIRIIYNVLLPYWKFCLRRN